MALLPHTTPLGLQLLFQVNTPYGALLEAHTTLQILLWPLLDVWGVYFQHWVLEHQINQVFAEHLL